MMHGPLPEPHSRTIRLLQWPAALLCLVCLAAPASASEEQQLVEHARHTLESFMKDPNWTWFQNHVKDAKAILIIPQP